MHPDQREQILALAENRIPAGIDPDSAEGRHYAKLSAAIAADVEKAPPMGNAQRARIVAMLRGGSDLRESA